MSSSESTSRPGHLRIATEEAWATSEMLNLYRRMLAENTLDDPGFKSLWGFYLGSQSPRPRFIIERLQELGQPRIDDMNASGVDKQILSLTSPGVQVFDAATAVSVAIRRWPGRLFDSLDDMLFPPFSMALPLLCSRAPQRPVCSCR